MTNITQQAMTFGCAISTCFAKFFDFKGRVTRPEFWWFYLFTVLLSWASILVDPSKVLSSIINLALFFPVIAAGARRLHDTNRSGWWQLLILIIIGLIPLVIWWASKGKSEENKYGSPPKKKQYPSIHENCIHRTTTPTIFIISTLFISSGLDVKCKELVRGIDKI